MPIFCFAPVCRSSVCRSVHQAMPSQYKYQLLNLVQWVSPKKQMIPIDFQITLYNVNDNLMMMSAQYLLTPSLESCQSFIQYSGCPQQEDDPIDFQVKIKLLVFVQILSTLPYFKIVKLGTMNDPRNQIFPIVPQVTCSKVKAKLLVIV